MSVPSPGVVIHLGLIVLACTHVSGGDVPIGVNGLMNQSILLSLLEDPSHPVQEVFWNFQSHIMATYINNHLTVKRDQFEGRLDILNKGKSLRIGQLRLEDSGLYTLSITFTDRITRDASYNLMVYEPVPTPSIVIEERKNNSDWCNVTLRCSVPTNVSSFPYTWKYRHGGSAYQIYNNGNTIQMSLQPESWDTEVLCIVHNPADSKNVSLQKFCPDYNPSSSGGEQNRSYYMLLVLLVLIGLVFLGWFLIRMKRKRRKDGTPTVTENINGESHYIQVTTVLPNDDRQEWNNSIYDSSPRQKPKAVTVYATLDHPPITNR